MKWDECVHASVCTLKGTLLCAHLESQSKKGGQRRERERECRREDGRPAGRRVAGWKGEPEVVSQPAFKSSPLGLTEPATIRSVSPSVPLPPLPSGPPDERVLLSQPWRRWKREKKKKKKKQQQTWPKVKQGQAETWGSVLLQINATLPL